MNTIALTLGLPPANTEGHDNHHDHRIALRAHPRAYDECASTTCTSSTAYDENMVFRTLDRMEGLDEFKIHMEAMYQYVTDIRWTYHDEAIDGDTTSSPDHDPHHQGPNKGEPFFTTDAPPPEIRRKRQDHLPPRLPTGEYIYERVPVVKWFVKKAPPQGGRGGAGEGASRKAALGE